jgi:cobalt/nickel transport protein
MTRRRFFGAVLLVSLLVAGVGSLYASSRPDGLEYVADKAGFLDQAEQRTAAGGPVAGVAGVLIVLLVMGGLAYAVRRRGPGPDID